MPRKAKLRRRSNGYSIEKHGDILTSGHDYFGPLECAVHRQEAWKALRSEILPAFILKHPGERPRAWWDFDLPADTRRACTSGTHPYDDPTNDLPRELYYGKPRYLRACDMSATYESQTEFLRRHSMLNAAELRSYPERKQHHDTNENHHQSSTR
jgi:hypothetical protein